MRLKSLKSILLLLLVLVAAGFSAARVAAQAEPRVTIYFFWGDGCPHCATAEPFLEGLVKKYPGTELRDYEVWYVEENRQLLHGMGDKFGFDPAGVPTIFIGSKHWMGFNEDIAREIEATLSQCLKSTCEDAGAGVITPLPEAPVANGAETVEPGGHLITLPVLGTVDLDSQSLILSTALIAFVDGFNPCSLWVLSMLMALVLHTGSRKKILLIGLIFLTVTAGVYALFIAGLFSVLSFVSFLGWVQVLVAGVALVFALVNIKDYFWYKEGLSFTISDKDKGGIFQNMRKVIASSDSLLGLVGATVVMSAGVSLVEFSCTAGFPVLWTNLLTAQGVTTPTFVLLLLLYLLIYQIDELAIFLTVVFTLKASRLEEKHGRILKLVGGMLMLTLAVVMLVNPSLLNNLGSSLLIFGIAFGATLLVLGVHRWLLPRLNTKRATETDKGRSRRHSPRRQT